ncbi:Hypothetical predicted protein, partial [Paramuricea clavata]
MPDVENQQEDINLTRTNIEGLPRAANHPHYCRPRSGDEESQENVDHPGTSDFASQTSPDLTSNTPRKKKIRRAYKYKKDQVQKLRKKLSFKKKSKKEKTLEEALAKLPDHMANFIREQIKLHSKKNHGRRYSAEMKTIALSLYHASGKAYRVLSKIFILPTKSSLKRYISKIPTKA